MNCLTSCSPENTCSSVTSSPNSPLIETHQNFFDSLNLMAIKSPSGDTHLILTSPLDAQLILPF